MNPKLETLAYRIWAYASPRGWRCTIAELAEALDETPSGIASVLRTKRWYRRLVSSSPRSLDIQRYVWLGGEFQTPFPEEFRNRSQE